MSQSFMPSDGNGTPDFLSIINAEVNKVEPKILVLPAPSVLSLMLPLLLSLAIIFVES